MQSAARNMPEAKSSCGAKETECGQFDLEARFRRLRIEQLRQRIEQGTFRVNALEIAAAMLVEEDETEFGEVVVRNEQSRERAKTNSPFLH